jgi:hypothetical protein
MQIIGRLITILLLVCGLLVIAPVTHAQQWCGGCQVGETNWLNPETGQYEWIDGCNGCTATDCPPGQYRPPDGSACRDIVTSCACGEFYACPTANNPGKQCACCPAEAACRNAKVDCPAGTVRSSTVTGSVCSTVNGEGICGGIGSAQVSDSSQI